jgi:hypothetical protein
MSGHAEIAFRHNDIQIVIVCHSGSMEKKRLPKGGLFFWLFCELYVGKKVVIIFFTIRKEKILLVRETVYSNESGKNVK